MERKLFECRYVSKPKCFLSASLSVCLSVCLSLSLSLFHTHTHTHTQTHTHTHTHIHTYTRFPLSAFFCLLSLVNAVLCSSLCYNYFTRRMQDTPYCARYGHCFVKGVSNNSFQSLLTGSLMKAQASCTP